MPKRTKPRAGSLQFWPRKRARRIYPRTNYWAKSKETVPLGFAGWKAGMTHVQLTENNKNSKLYGKIITKSVTILDSPSLLVCGVRYYKKTHDGLKSIGEKWIEKLPKEVKLNTGNKKSSKEIHMEDVHDVTLIVSTQPSKSGMHKKKTDVFEMGVGGELSKKIPYAESLLGKEIGAKDVLKPGEFVDISAITKGHGYTGPVKRFGIRIQTRKDQQHHRHAGSIGGVVPRKVDWRVPLPGQYGFFTRTEFNKKILMIDEGAKANPKGGFVGYGVVPKTFVMIEGSIPGPRKRLIRIRKSVRKKIVSPVEISYISLESKQGA